MSVLFTPFAAGPVLLKNRVVMPPMASRAADGGMLTTEHLDYYLPRAEAGTGLIITEHMYVDRRGMADPHQLAIDSDDRIPGLSKLTRLTRNAGARIIAQISHAGSMAHQRVTGMTPVSSSDVLSPTMSSTEVPEELTVPEIRELVKKFRDAAVRAQKAGFDGVDVHSAHGYLLDQFFSPLANKRHDAYGRDSVENRVRIHCEILRAIRESTGPAFLIALRLGGSDYMNGGATVEDAAKAVPLLREAGMDLLDISGGMNGYTISGRKDPGWFRDIAEAVRGTAAGRDLPILLTGGIKKPEDAEALLQSGICDLVGVGRAMRRCPDWTARAWDEMESKQNH